MAVLDLTQQATSHSPNIKGFGASFDGVDYQLYKNKKLSFKLLMASYTSNSRSIPLGDVSVNDVSRLLVFSPTSRNIGGVASSRLLLTLPDLSVIEALDGQVVKLPSSVTGSISIVRQLYSNSRFSHKGVGGSQLVVGDIVDVASYVSGRIKTEDGCRLRLDVVGSVPDGSGVLTYVSDADTVNWELMTLVGSPEPQGAGVFKYSYLSDVIFGTNDIVFRVRLNGTSDAVPVIKSVSAETVFTYVYALKNGDPLNRFKVADGVDNDEAVSKGQLNTKANLGGSNTQRFKIADGVDEDEAASIGQLEALSGVSVTNYALKNGDPLNRFKIADGVDNDEAVSKGQLDAVATANLTSLAVVNLIYPVGIVVDFSVNTNPNAIWSGTIWERFAEGQVTVGYNSGDADFGTIGQTGGAKGHVMSSSNLIAHTHTMDNVIGSSTQSGGGGGATPTRFIQDQQGTTNSTGETVPDPIPTLPPYVVVAKWVRTD